MSNNAEVAFLERDAQHLIHPLHNKAVHATGKVWVGGKGAYLVDAKPGPNGPEPTHFRETFRTRGPSNYAHGKQAEEFANV